MNLSQFVQVGNAGHRLVQSQSLVNEHKNLIYMAKLVFVDNCTPNICLPRILCHNFRSQSVAGADSSYANLFLSNQFIKALRHVT